MRMQTKEEIINVTKDASSSIWKHITNWVEAYFWIPVAVISIPLLSHFAYYLSGYKPKENLDFLPEFGFRILQCIVVIVLVSVSRQAVGIWMTKEEQFENPRLAIAQRVSSLILFILWAYVLTH